ncbi:MAG: heme peroxidase family protein [Saprospiraceae bacterium]
MSNQKHHGIRQRHSMNHLCNPSSYEYEREGRFGRLFRSKHHAVPLYSNPQALIELGKKGGIMDSQGVKELTNTVPLGMIFLGQFIDHDITFDTQSRFNRVNAPEEIENFRTPNLDLDSIFGEGPEDEGFLYESNSLKLVTGATNRNIAQAQNLEREDLARNGQGKALIGDPRNDENRIISQLQLLFIRFYNKVYDQVAAAHPSYPAEEVYEEARLITTWHYQWIVLNEFLPLLVGKNLMSNIMAEGRQWYQPIDRPYMPVEFSVAAYRFGHSMIPQKLRLQAGGQEHDLFSTDIGGGFSKIENLNQVVHWDQFFDVNGTHQLATKLDTKLSSELLELPFLPAQVPAAEKSLATRNLRRANSFLLPSGQTVAKCMQIDPPVVDRVVDAAQDLIRNQNIDLSSGIPLWFYILAEGGEIGRDGDPGEGLGPLGGRIVGEVLYGLLELDESSFLGANRNWVPTLSATGNFTMKDLIDFATA